MFNTILDVQHDMIKPKLYTKQEVLDIVAEVMDYYRVQNTTKRWDDFERRLNDQGLNANNWAHESRLEKYEEEQIKSFIY